MADRDSLVTEAARTLRTAIRHPKGALNLIAGIAIAAGWIVSDEVATRRRQRQRGQAAPIHPARRRLRAITRWVRWPYDLAVQLALLAAHMVGSAARQWQEDRRTAYRFGYPTTREARRLRRQKRRAQNAATYRSWADGHEHPER